MVYAKVIRKIEEIITIVPLLRFFSKPHPQLSKSITQTNPSQYSPNLLPPTYAERVRPAPAFPFFW